MMDDRPNLIALLSEARGMLAASTTYLDAVATHAPHLAEGPVRLKGRIETFLEAGLFGDRQKGG